MRAWVCCEGNIVAPPPAAPPPPLPILLSAPKSILRKADIEKFAIKKKKSLQYSFTKPVSKLLLVGYPTVQGMEVKSRI